MRSALAASRTVARRRAGTERRRRRPARTPAPLDDRHARDRARLRPTARCRRNQRRPANPAAACAGARRRSRAATRAAPRRSPRTAPARRRALAGDGAAAARLPGLEERLEHLVDERPLGPRPERLLVVRLFLQPQDLRREVHERAREVLIDRADLVPRLAARRRACPWKRGSPRGVRDRRSASHAAAAPRGHRVRCGSREHGFVREDAGRRAGDARRSRQTALGQVVQKRRRLDDRVVLERDRRGDGPAVPAACSEVFERARAPPPARRRPRGQPRSESIDGRIEDVAARLSGHSCWVRPTRCSVSKSPKRAAWASRSWTPPSPPRGENVCRSIHRRTAATVSANGRGASSKPRVRVAQARQCREHSRPRSEVPLDDVRRPAAGRSCASRNAMTVQVRVGGASSEAAPARPRRRPRRRAARCRSPGDDHSRAKRASSAGSAR